MATVPLRVYSREIENLVESGHLDEAIAHCQHILKSYPMHMDTYRLLGKAFLESRRYTDAADIFQRSLMAVPDDFVSHVGMSIIRDDEGKLDDAIWHMERAFEIQPSNPAIQGELRRLYGRRDGVEPPKIRLSRDALANMYSQGELFNQAIAEIRSVLAEDPNRPDLQVMLARAYYRAGHKVEAAEMAAVLLKKYPYCQDALRILVDVIPASSNTDNLQVYRQRLAALDPYSNFTSGSMFQTDQVSDAAVSLEQLEYASGNLPLGMQPNWASSLGIKLDEEKPVDSPPSWLAEGAVDAPVSSGGEPTPEPEQQPSSSGEEPIPDWMRTVGWQESTGAAPETPVQFEAEAPAEPIAEAEIPDWLKSMAPAQTEDAATPVDSVVPDDNGGEDGLPDWLKPAAGVAVAGLATASAPADELAAAAVDIPDWLQGGVSDQPQDMSTGQDLLAPGDSGDRVQPSLDAEPLDAGLFQAQSLEKQPDTGQDAMPDWLNSLGGSDSSADVLPQESAPEQKIDEPILHPGAQAENIPAGRVEETGKSSLDESQPFQPTGESKPLDIGDDALAWLESLAAKQGAKPEELLTSADERNEDMPDWLRDIRETPDLADVPAAGDDSTPLDARVDTIRMNARPPEEGDVGKSTVQPVESPEQEIPSSPVEFDGTKDWMSQDKSELGGVNEPAQPDSGILADLPDWMKPDGEGQSGAGEDSAISGTVADSGLVFAEQQPVQSDISPAADEGARQGSVPEDDITITSWLSKKDVARELESRGLTANLDAAPQADLPDWLQDMDKKSVPVSAMDANAQAQGNDIPEWLQQPVQAPEEGTVPADKATEDTDMSSWLDEAAPISQPPSPTSPEEWVPVDRQTGGQAGAEMPEVLRAAPQPGQKAAPASTDKTSPVLQKPPVQDKDADILAGAQTSLSANRLDEAMNQYAKLIKKGRLLEDVIQNLRDAVYRHPVDVVVWQTLGDAYMRANRLQDALDAYTKAEDLLR